MRAVISFAASLLLLLPGLVRSKFHKRHNISVVICDFFRPPPIAQESRLHHNDEIELRQAVLENHRQYAVSHHYHYYRHNFSDKDHMINLHLSGKRHSVSIGHGISGAHRHAVSKHNTYHWFKLPLIKALFGPPYNHDFVLYIDSDAIFLDMSVSIFDILEQNRVFSGRSTIAQFAFSGDVSAAVNSGVMLLRNSRWTRSMLEDVSRLGELLETTHGKEETIGMGGDNAAFLIYMGGCNSSDVAQSMAVLKACFDRVNIAYNTETRALNPEIALKIAEADMEVYEKMVPADILDHLAVIPQRQFNSFDPEKARFIVHSSLSRKKGHDDRRTQLAKALSMVKPVKGVPQ